jgi:magnesium transporter
VIIDSAVYRNGAREPGTPEFSDLFAACQSGDAMAWIGLYEPTHEELESVAKAFHLHELAVEDAITAHQRPKFERYEGMHFVVLRPARYVDETLIQHGRYGVASGEGFYRYPNPAFRQPGVECVATLIKPKLGHVTAE